MLNFLQKYILATFSKWYLFLISLFQLRNIIRILWNFFFTKIYKITLSNYWFSYCLYLVLLYGLFWSFIIYIFYLLWVNYFFLFEICTEARDFPDDKAMHAFFLLQNSFFNFGFIPRDLFDYYIMSTYVIPLAKIPFKIYLVYYYLNYCDLVSIEYYYHYLIGGYTPIVAVTHLIHYPDFMFLDNIFDVLLSVIDAWVLEEAKYEDHYRMLNYFHACFINEYALMSIFFNYILEYILYFKYIFIFLLFIFIFIHCFFSFNYIFKDYVRNIHKTLYIFYIYLLFYLVFRINFFFIFGLVFWNFNYFTFFLILITLFSSLLNNNKLLFNNFITYFMASLFAVFMFGIIIYMCWFFSLYHMMFSIFLYHNWDLDTREFEIFLYQWWYDYNFTIISFIDLFYLYWNKYIPIYIYDVILEVLNSWYI